MEGDGDGEDETATAVRGFEGGALVLGTSFLWLCRFAGLWRSTALGSVFLHHLQNKQHQHQQQ